MSRQKIAIFAEDDTDCDAIREIIHRVLGRSVPIKKWASKGCSTLKRKLTAKLKVMSSQGCDVFIIVHDLDRNPKTGQLNDENDLRKLLEASASSVPNITKHICIPIEELEAWFWADQNVIQHVGRGKGRCHPNPRLLEKPKENLIRLSVGENRKPRYSTNMNIKLAAMLNLSVCASRCKSFKELLDFLNAI